MSNPVLRPEVQAMFDRAQAKLVTLGLDVRKFEAFKSGVLANSEAVIALNGLYPDGLQDFVINPSLNNIAQYNTPNKTMDFLPSIILNDVASALIIFYHELGHAVNRGRYAADTSTSTTQMASAIAAAAANGGKADLTATLLSFWNAGLVTEAIATMQAFNMYKGGPVVSNDLNSIFAIVANSNGLLDPLTKLPVEALRGPDNKFKTDEASYLLAANLLRGKGWDSTYLAGAFTQMCWAAKGALFTIDMAAISADRNKTVTFEDILVFVQSKGFKPGHTGICRIEDASTGKVAEVIAKGALAEVTVRDSTGTRVLKNFTMPNGSRTANPFALPVGVWFGADGNPLSLQTTSGNSTQLINFASLPADVQKLLRDVLAAASKDGRSDGSTLPGDYPTASIDGNKIVITLPRGLKQTKDGLKDKFGRQVSILLGSDGKVLESAAAEAGVRVLKTYDATGQATSTKVQIRLGELINFSNAGAILGQQVGQLLAGENKVAGVVTSAALQTIGHSLGQVLDGAVSGQSIKQTVDKAFDGFGDNFLKNLKSAGVGAVSSFLTAELMRVLNVGGVPGELLNTAAGSVINTVVTNLANGATTASQIFNGVGSAATLGSAIGSYIGNKLANELVSFDTIGGQLGSSVGSALGSIAGFAIGKAIFQGLGVALAGPLGAAIGAFLGTILGGYIGSLFGGTPRSGADVQWDAAAGEFAVSNVYAKKGGSKDAAKGMATAVAQTFNNIIGATGGTLMNPELVQSGNYGMRKSDFVYRPVATRDKDAITQRFSGEGAAQRLIGYGLYQGLADADFRIAGGNVLTKRAIYNTFANGGLDPLDFDASVVLGNIVFAQRYEAYLENSLWVNALVASEPDSAFAAETALTLAKAVELGLTRRHASDWYGGFTFLIDQAGTTAANVNFSFGYDPFADRIARSIDIGDFFLGDTVDIAGQTEITGTAEGDRIRLTGDHLVETSGSGELGDVNSINHRLTVDGAFHNGFAFTIDVAATIDAGAGTDYVYASDRGDNVFGGAGDDTLYGGKLDDWLIGGDGVDTIHAGDEAGNFAGDGNYLDGGAGNDTLHGGEGSDWLEGGDGDDVIEGGGGEDILTGGAGHDILRGGTGGDTYLIRAGDQNDEAEDVITAQVVNTITVLDPVKERFARIAAGTLAKNWGGDGFDLKVARLANEAAENAAEAAAQNGTGTGVLAAPVAIAPVQAAGEDSIVFGAGIELGNIRITRFGGANGADLLIQVTTLNAAGDDQEPTGTQLIVKDWFVNPFKRIEWLKLADGTEVRIGDFTSFVAGTAAGDVLIGTSGDDFVVAGAGDDQLHLLTGNDVGNGGTGDDLVAGDGGSDLLLGGLGDDKLMGGGERDAMSGDGGSDDIYGGSGDDILSGGKGDDQVAGGQGNDVFKYARGDGRDIVFDEFSSNWVTVWSAATRDYDPAFTRNQTTGEITAADGTFIYKNMGTTDAPDYRWLGRFDFDSANGILYRFDHNVAASASVVNAGTDMIEFAIGIDIQDVILTRAAPTSPDLVLTITQEDEELTGYLASTDSITIRNWYTVPGQIEKLAFYQTGTLSIGPGGMNLVAGTDLANGTSSAPLAGTAAADWITGGAGDDFLAGGLADDILSGNSGFDTLKGEAGKDVLYGGAGNDMLDAGDGSTTLFSADMLYGGAGVDTATYASVNAKVRAYLGAAWANAGAAAGDQYFDVENLTGSTWGGSVPTPGSGDVLGGDAGDNEITGARGDDTMMGGAGDDTYMWNGAEWSDVIREGAFTVEEAVDLQGKLVAGYRIRWSDTGAVWDPATGQTYMKLEVANARGETVYSWDKFAYPAASRPAPTDGFVAPAEPADASGWDQRGWGASGFSRTNGQQVTREKFDTSADGGQDTIEFGAGLSLSDYIFIRVGEDGLADDNGSSLMIRYQTSGVDYMLIKNHYTSWGAVETLQFRDGLSVSLANLLMADTGETLEGTGAAEFISALAGTSNEHLLGMGGNDVLSGLKGNDWLEGGDGDDTLEGGSGADTLDGGANSAAVVMPSPDPANPNAVLKPIVTPNWGDTVRYVRSLTGINVDLRKTTGQLGGDAAGDILIGIENVVGSGAGDTISGDDGGNRIDGLDGVNTIHGWGGDDIVAAGSGADFLYGDDGDDGVSGAEGIDNLYGGAGNDRVAGGAGNDKLWGEDGDDVLTAGEGDDSVVDGGLGKDELLGQEGNDTLTGGAGDDLLAGGTGNDAMVGGADNDRYLIERGFGTDTIADTQGVNALIFKDIAFNQLWLTQSGSDLLVRVVGTTDNVKILGFYSGGGRLRTIQTSTHTLFVDHSGTQALIDAMEDATGYPVVANTTTPLEMPADVAAKLGNYWHSGDKAAPTAPASATLAGPEDELVVHAGDWNVVDHDSNVTGYAVKAGAGPAHGVVQLTNPATGALTYRPHDNFNGADSFTLIATDADGQSVEFVVAVTITPVADGPQGLAPRDGPLSVEEAAPSSQTGNGTLVGYVVGTDPEQDTFYWTFAVDNGVTQNAEGRFGIAEDGRIFVVDASRLDRETNGSHNVTVLATDATGKSTDATFTISVADANDRNSIAAFAPVSLPEDTAIGTVIATALGSDTDQSGAFKAQRYFFLEGDVESDTSHDGRLKIDAVTGEIRLVDLLDHETAPAQTYVVAARDNPGGIQSYRATTTLLVTATDKNEANEFDPPGTMTISETAEAGSLVGQVHARDGDTSGPFAEQRYYFGDGSVRSAFSADDRYRIDPITGKIWTNRIIDVETETAPPTYRVIAVDNPGGTDQKVAEVQVEIVVTDFNDPNHLDPDTGFSIAENSAPGYVGTVVATDEDLSGDNARQTYSFLIGDAPAQISQDGRFEIGAVDGIITARVPFDHEATPHFSYAVVAWDSGPNANAATTTVKITVTDVNDANSFAGALVFTVAENSTASPGTVIAADGDAAGSLNARQAYFFRHSDGTDHVTSQDGRFTIGTATGIVAPVAAFDFETAAAPFGYVIVARDREGAAGGNSATTGLTIRIGNVNEAPTAPALAAAYAPIVAENADGWEAVFNLQDPDGTTPALHFLSNPGDIFTISGAKVVFTGLAAPSFEALYNGLNAVDSDQDGLWEVELSRSLRTVDSDGAYSAWVTGTVKVEDVNEAPTQVLTSMIVTQVIERDRVPASTPAAQAIAIATVSVEDPDSADFTTGQYTYAVDDDRFELINGTLFLKASGKLDFEEGDGIARVKVTATDKTGGPSAKVIDKTIEITVLDRTDVLEGDLNPNTLAGQKNRDEIYGFGGVDTIFGGDGDDLLDGGEGDDWINGGGGKDRVLGGLGTDAMAGGEGDDILEGGEGNDALVGGKGADRLDGGAGVNWVAYDTADAGPGATVGVTADLASPELNTAEAVGDIYINIGHLYGTALADTLRGDGAVNWLWSDVGDDTLVGRGGGDNLNGGEGNDVIYGDFENDPFNGTYSGHGADTLTGGVGNDTIYGGLGDDTLDGGAGDDTLYAQGDNDKLYGGVGDDVLNGGPGSDTYYMDRASEQDTIFNYKAAGDTDIDTIGILNDAGIVLNKHVWFKQVDNNGQESRTGSDLKISILGSDSSMTVKGWFPAGNNARVDLIVLKDNYTHHIKVDELVELMRDLTAPPAATDQAWWDKWGAAWFENHAPTIQVEASKTVDEDAAATFDVVVTDDISTQSGFTFTRPITQGADLVESITLGPVGADGHMAFTVTPKAHKSGKVVILLTAFDAGGHPSETKTLTVDIVGTPDKPGVAQFSATPGTSGLAAGHAVQLQTAFPDDDGSEVHEIRITGIPSGVTLSAGTYNSVGGYWSLTRAQAAGLKLMTPAGWYQDLTLTAHAYATENGTTVPSDPVSTSVVINAAPVGVKINNAAGASIAENSTALIGTITGQDNDLGDNLIFTLANAATSPFKLVGNQLFANSASALNFEAATSHGVSIIVTDSWNASFTGTLTINVTDVNEAPVVPPAQNLSVPENAVNALAGTVQATDPDSAASPFGQLRYGFLAGGVWQADSADGRFTVDSLTGQVRTKVALDKEAASSYAYVIAARDNAGAVGYNQALTNVTIAVTDVNEPNSLAARTFVVNENQAAVVSVGFAGATDQDSPASSYGKQLYAFEIAAANGSVPAVYDTVTADGLYSIDAATGEIKTRRAFNKEVDVTTSYLVVARDNLGNLPSFRASATFTLQIGDVNEANSIIGAFEGTIGEDAAVGLATRIKVTGTANDLRIEASDFDSPTTEFGTQKYYFTSGSTSADGLYSLSADGRFKLEVNSGYISVAAALDYEGPASSFTYNLIVRDNAGKPGFNEKPSSLVISLTNVNDPNDLPDRYDLAVDENKTSGFQIGQVTATDYDGTVHTYGHQRYFFKHSNGTVHDLSEDQRFSINVTTGAISLNGSPNAETYGAPRDYLVVARDNAGAAGFNEAQSRVWITVNNLPERPNAPAGPAAVNFDEAGIGSQPAGAGLEFAAYTLTDQDGPAPRLEFAPGGNPGNWFTISGNKVFFNFNFDFEWAVASGFAQGDHNGDGIADVFIGNVVVQANDDVTAPVTTTTAFYLSNTPERPNPITPHSPALHSETLPGDASHAGQVIARFNRSDNDGPTPGLAIVGGNPHGWFTTSGDALIFNGANFTAEYLRAYVGQHGMDNGWHFDWDGDGLKEIRVATVTLKAVDAGGLASDPYDYSIYIEDKNEAPAFVAGSLTWSLLENPVYYQQVGTAQAGDVDGPAGELRFFFSGAGEYWDGALGRYVSASSDGKFVMDVLDGRVWVNGHQEINYESVKSLGYQMQVFDRSRGAHSLSGTGTFAITINDQNEPHSLSNAAAPIYERNVPLGPFVAQVTTTGDIIDLDSMLTDPENRRMRWSFSDGTTSDGTWQIEQDGTIRMVGPVDYDAMVATWQEEVIGYDQEGMPIYGQVRGADDPTKAVFNLNIKATDLTNDDEKHAVLTLNVADVNEDVTATSWASFSAHDGGTVVKKSETSYWVHGEVRENTGIFQINAVDPEGRPLTYEMTDRTVRDINASDGGHSDIDSGYPDVFLSGNRVNFTLPAGSRGGNDDYWQGGTYTAGYNRRSLSIEYTFNVRITDSVGKVTIIPYTVTFLRRGSPIPPIVFDLDGDGLELVAYSGSTVKFDMDGDSIADRTGWVGADDGLLALDRNGNGTIDGIGEISFTSDSAGAQSDLEGLAAFDSNSNGLLDAGDARFAEFRIWKDSNQNGVSDAGELVSLAEAGIVSVNLTLNRTGEEPGGAENVVYATSSYLRSDGVRREVGDVFLAFDASNLDKLAAPIVLDYDGDGSGLVSRADSSALFDMDGDGDVDSTGWIARGDALLVLDRDGNGRINGIAEISFKADKAGARTDLEGLAAFDSNGDGVLGTHDARFGEFQLWFDSNGNGASDAGELLTLAEAGILEVSLAAAINPDAQADSGGNVIFGKGSFTRTDHSTGILLDAGFRYSDAALAPSAPPAAAPPPAAAAAEPAPPASSAAGPAHPTPAPAAEPAPPVSSAAGPAPAQSPPVEPAPVPEPASESAPSARFGPASFSFGRRSEHYRITAAAGVLAVTPRKGTADAGTVGPAALLSFRDRRYGLLSPLILDVDGDGIEMERRGAATARFDMDGDGTLDDTGWIGRDDGFLLIDGGGDGVIGSPDELSLLGLKKGAKSSFEALAVLDSNGDGRIGAGDDRLAEVRIWRDSNGNGVSDRGELHSLADLGIASVGLEAQWLGGSVKLDRNLVFASSGFTRTDGSVGMIGDAALSFRPAGAASRRPDGPVAGLAQQWLGTLRNDVETLRGLDHRFGRALSRDAGLDPDPTGAEAQLAAAADGIGLEAAPDLRLAKIVEMMAGFGAQAGEGALRPSAATLNPRFEYFA